MKVKRTVILTSVLLALACARMMSPGGGPVDDEQPELLEVLPEPGPGQPGLTSVTLYWSERLDAASSIVFLYPPVEHTVHVSGERITLELEHPLGGETIVLHLPPEISDRRGNISGISHDLVFSGGEVLPACEVRVELARQGGGNVSDRTLAEIFRAGPDSDSELIRRTTADSTGSVIIRWLEPGDYRLLCYEDSDRSFQWSSEREAGMDTTITLESPSGSVDLFMTLTVVDTVGPALVEAEVNDRYHVTLVMNEEVSLESFSAGEVAFARDSSDITVPVMAFWLQGGTSNRTVILETGEMQPGGITMRMEGIRDLLGNPSRADSMDLTVPDSLPSDSLRIRSHYPAPDGEGIDPAGPYNISFSFYVNEDTLNNHLSLTRISDSTIVQGRWTAIDGRSFDFYPEHQLIGEQQHRFLLLPGLATAWGDSMDTPFSWSFQPAWGDEPGAISGSVSGTSAQFLVLQVSRTGGDGDGSVRYSTIGPGNYLLENMPAGRYTVSAFVDRDGDGQWDPMEPYGTCPGVVVVQPGLISEGVDIEILP